VPGVGDVDIRAVEEDAARQRSLAIWNAVYWTMPASEADRESYLARCLGHAEYLASLDGEPVGTGDVELHPDAATPELAMVHVAVLPSARRRGGGTALYQAVSAWARGHGRTQLETWVLDADSDGVTFAAARGFEEVFHDALVALDLAGLEPPDVAPPNGIAIVTWADRPELARGMYGVMCEAAPDIPGHDAGTPGYEEWVEHDMGAASDRPDATFVALAGDEVVGYAKFHLSSARPGVAVHDLTGVKRSWRGRGIARALKAAQIAWAMREGYERLETANELGNAPIRKLNAEFGYRPIPGRALLRGPLAPGR
jgi:mycothiol synthase